MADQEPGPPTMVVVKLHGALDLQTKDAALAQLLDAVRGRHHVEVDMSEVTFVDSTAISMLVRVRDLAAADGLRLRVSHPAPLVLRVLRVTGVHDLLTGR
ncbi:STAS domain-containing protein [Hamadaea sp. NPDC050747]|uniref:STAS domain-containing protein n=1 Tax=Hamadaea sp. NPDC050747 TaxID=3155789 RepID=UPI0033C0D80B